MRTSMPVGEPRKPMIGPSGALDAARRALGDAAGTRALVGVLLAHRTQPCRRFRNIVTAARQHPVAPGTASSADGGASWRCCWRWPRRGSTSARSRSIRHSLQSEAGEGVAARTAAGRPPRRGPVRRDERVGSDGRRGSRAAPAAGAGGARSGRRERGWCPSPRPCWVGSTSVNGKVTAPSDT
jgi:hypothetical protein